MDVGERMKFRYSTYEDTKFFLNELIDNPKENLYLGFHGFEENSLKNSVYRVTFVAEGEVRRGDDFITERLGFVTIEGGSISGFNQICLLYVLPEFRKEGNGETLLKFAEEYILEHYPTIGIEVYTNDNDPMNKLLQKRDFMESGEMKDVGYR